MVRAVNGALARLARLDANDEDVRRELEAVDIALVRMREILHTHRWL